MEPPGIDEIIYRWKPIYQSFETRVPIILVSKAWKARAESTPGLWTFIWVKEDCSDEKNLSLARSLFLRSGSLPINLTVNGPTSISEPFLQLLRSNIVRSRTLGIFLGFDELNNNVNECFTVEYILPSSDIELPNLKSLTSFCDYNRVVDPWVYSIHAPHLKASGLSENGILTLNNLTMDTLHALHTLKICRVVDPLDMKMFINCPNLHLRRFDKSEEFTPLWIKGFFKVPALKHLCYMRPANSPRVGKPSLLHINEFAPFSCTLISMDLASFNLTVLKEGSVPFFPNLTIFEIHNCNIEDNFFDFLDMTIGEDNKPET
ncbi:hypothetical protein M422DRAFT_257035 [Sphaerobolus stellatus SS14]|uniref:Uncharacterized protein n=1 Tax=Sphaerobolus stellatus (strain SS14) TaxID=990650 RepID=A0A0C9UAN3_SPHS4|nr:hypothetical protein M422DRAFT_257035 [Sphaerobolus stellatus SS14]